MAQRDELIDFSILESSKENIQSLPGGRSARQLASVLSPVPSANGSKSPNLEETKTLNDAIRQEYELELKSINEADDPLDIYDRYVKWTLNAYPSAQSTPQSQLLPLLERATKAFLTSSHYKNDPRYLKLWLHYIRLFSDAPRETFAFLARHNIGETLGLFYEEFAAWLESAGRWNQAEEVYKMGIEREARPVERLMRKYKQFQQRYEARPQNGQEPSSPALPTVRPALAAKIDPFAPTTHEDSQQSSRSTAARPPPSRSGKPKMAIFSDADSAGAPPTQVTSKGWDSIGSMKERKKENTMEARPWLGETLKSDSRAGTVSKMEVFKDPTLRNNATNINQSSKSLDVVNPRTGRTERVFVNLEAVYPNEQEEYSFEELRAIKRKWSTQDWTSPNRNVLKSASGNGQPSPQPPTALESVDVENLTENFQSNLSIVDTSTQSMVGMPGTKPPKPRRTKVREIKQEVQTVKTRLESPTGPKLKRKASAEPTMTFHSKAATNDIYDMFNQPLRKTENEDTFSGEESDLGDDTYSTGGESTGTGKISAATSEFGDDTLASVRTGCEERTGSQPTSVSPWSDFTASRHVPRLDAQKKTKTGKHKHMPSDDVTENMDSSQNQTQTSGIGGSFDTQAIAAIANQDFDDLDTKAIAKLAGDETKASSVEEGEADIEADTEADSEALQTPVEADFLDQIEVKNKPRYIPLPPEDYEPTPLRSYRDPEAVAQNKLPFMTPIAEQTESSVAPGTMYMDADYFGSKTPSRSTLKKWSEYESPSKLKLENLLMSSPHKESPKSSAKRRREQVGATEEKLLTSSPPKKVACRPTSQDIDKPLFDLHANGHQAAPAKVKDDVFKQPIALASGSSNCQPSRPQEPIIVDLQCNPCDPTIREQILVAVQPPLSSYPGYFESKSESFDHHNTLKVYAEKLGKQKTATKFSPRKSQTEKTITKVVPPILNFSKTSRIYAVKRELGKGAFAPVYLVDSHDSTTAAPTSSSSEDHHPGGQDDRRDLEALKSESPPYTLAWEFHVLRLLRSRLSPTSRTLASIILAHECHLYRDECYLVLSYSPQGTLLELVNAVRNENARMGKPTDGVGLDEAVAMFFAVELLRTMESLHNVGILHGDLKADNCLVRFDPAELAEPYNGRGEGGWAAKGLKLIDFGRGIDTKMFKPEAKFVADWEAQREDCHEIREARPWKWQIDFYGAAGVVHALLFGKYMETVPVAGGDGVGGRKEYRVREGFKRYWEKELWGEVFGALFNGGGEEDEGLRMKEVMRVRGLMERWLEGEGERRDLRGKIRGAERMVGMRK